MFFRSLKALVYQTRREIALFHDFVESNSAAAFGPAFVSAIAPFYGAYLTSTAPVTDLASITLSYATWISIYLYFFDISNQLTGVEEDKVNKPTRPIPSGQVTVQGAKIRQILILVLFLSTGALDKRIFIPTCLWILDVYMLCYSPLGKHWFFKNIVGMTVGTYSIMAASAIFAAPAGTFLSCTPGLRHASLVSLWTGCIAPVQDWRDIEGDIKVGRYTLPIAFGNQASRWIYVLVLEPFALAILWRAGLSPMGGMLAIPAVVLVILHFVLGDRVVKGYLKAQNVANYDHWSYNITIGMIMLVMAIASYDTIRSPQNVHCTAKVAL